MTHTESLNLTPVQETIEIETPLLPATQLDTLEPQGEAVSGSPDITRIKFAWLDLAACRNSDDLDNFFREGEDEEAAERKAAMAISICKKCPVILACLQAAQAQNEQFGVWGGVNFDTGESGTVTAAKPLQAKTEGPLPEGYKTAAMMATELGVLTHRIGDIARQLHQSNRLTDEPVLKYRVPVESSVNGSGWKSKTAWMNVYSPLQQKYIVNYYESLAGSTTSAQ